MPGWFEKEKIMVPVIDVLDLKVAAQTLRPIQTFSFITRVIFQLNWASAALTFTAFGADSALTNGIQITYLGHDVLPVTWKKVNDFSLYAYDTRIDSDGVGTPNRTMTSRISFYKFTYETRGLRISPYRPFAIIVKDDLSSSSNDSIQLAIEGWRWE